MQTLVIKPELYPTCPREWDNVGTMVTWHRRYRIGDEHEFSTPDDFKAEVTDDNSVILPLFLYDHSIQSVSTRSFIGRAHHADWDSAQVGWIYASKEKIRQEFGCKRVTKKVIERVEALLKGEVEQYDQYLRGDIYRFELSDENGEVVDSCGGFYGDDWENNGLKDHIPDELHSQLEDIEITFS